MAVDVTDLSVLAKDLRGSGAELISDISRSATAAGSRIEKSARRDAPFREGDLRRSTSMKKSRSRRLITVTVTATDEAALFQEYGTTRHPAQPFLRPALAAEIPGFLDDVEQAVQDLL